MRHIVLITTIICITPYNAFADRVCIRKSDGVPIEYQTGNAPLGTLTQNALASGYKANEVEERYITTGEYKNLHKEKIAKPAEDEAKAKEDAAKDAIKEKLNLTDKDIEDLKEIIR